MTKHRVLLTDYAWGNLDIERWILSKIGAELVVAQQQDANSLASLAGDVDAIMTTWAKVSSAVITAAIKCRIVARLGIGLDNIDVNACTQRGILVTNVPNYCQVEVAEHALAMLFSLSRKISFYHHQTKSGHYDLQAGPPLRRIEGQTLGIIGLGSIGRKLAEKGLGIGLKVIATERRDSEPDTLIPRCSLDELLQRSDYISLHVPVTDETKHMIGREQFKRMKPSAYLINTARGGLIDHAALADALAGQQLAGAALDVFDPEPPALSQPPFNDPRVIVTPHAAFCSQESLETLRRTAAGQVADCLQGKKPMHVVNRDVLG